MKAKMEVEMTKLDIVTCLTIGTLMLYFLGCAYSSASKKAKKEKDKK